MKKLLFTILIVAVATALVIAANAVKTTKQSLTEGAGETTPAVGFAVLELFTSQGCSSCPPADELLGKYVHENNDYIIPIAFHVDYWNRLGWKDSFSTGEYSQRQHEYAQAFSNNSVYTPQVVVNGVAEMVGSDEDKISKAVNKALKETPLATITINSKEITGNKIFIQYNVTGGITSTNIVALLVQNKTTTNIKAGENNGATLKGYNVVRSFGSTTAQTSGSCTLQLPSNTDVKNLSIVLFTQNVNSLKITGAVKKPV